MCKTNAGSKLKNLQARLSPKQEVTAFIALFTTFTLIHRNLVRLYCPKIPSIIGMGAEKFFRSNSFFPVAADDLRPFKVARA